MKVKIEPSRLQYLLENTLLHHKVTGLDSVVGHFTPKGVSFADLSLEVLAIKAVFNKTFFLSYEAEKEDIVLSKSLHEQIKKGFSGDDEVTLLTENDTIRVIGEREKYEEPLIQPDEGPFPLEFVTDKEKGMLPKDLNANVHVAIDASQFTNLQKADEYAIRCDGEKLTVIVTDVGTYRKVIPTHKVDVMDEVEMTFAGRLFRAIANQYSGDIWFALKKDGAVFSQKRKDYMLTYPLTSL